MKRMAKAANSGNLKPEENSGKNYAKRDSYALAFGLIKTAIREGYPLQAIAVEESILADRLWSTLNVGAIKPQNVGTLGGALKQWCPTNADGRTKQTANPHHNVKLFDGYMNALQPMLLDWWNARNKVLHGIAKSFQGKAPDLCADDFTAYAQFVAEIGLVLVRQVGNWTQKQIRKARRNKGRTNDCAV